MGSLPAQLVEQEIDQRILSLLQRYRSLAFTEMADALPEYKWRDLLGSLIRLKVHEAVRLTPLRWDYEITATNPDREAMSGRARPG